jgi:hypothetical protein
MHLTFQMYFSYMIFQYTTFLKILSVEGQLWEYVQYSGRGNRVTTPKTTSSFLLRICLFDRCTIYQ